MPQEPRRLCRLKCTQCRKDRQKCTPYERPWPGERCDRCTKFDYPCSKNISAKEDRSMNLADSRGEESGRMNEGVAYRSLSTSKTNVATANFGRIFGTPSGLIAVPIETESPSYGENDNPGDASAGGCSTDSNRKESESTSDGVDGIFDSVKDEPRFKWTKAHWIPSRPGMLSVQETNVSSQSFEEKDTIVDITIKDFLNVTSSLSRAAPKCAKYFKSLIRVGWEDRYPPLRKYPFQLCEDPGNCLRELATFPCKLPTYYMHLFYKNLERRKTCVMISSEQSGLSESHTANDAPPLDVVGSFWDFTDLIAVMQPEYGPRKPRGLGEACLDSLDIREGKRWRDLIDAMGAREILLIDAGYGDDVDASFRDHTERVDEKWWWMGEYIQICQQDSSPSDIVECVRYGSDSVFTRLKEVLMSPALQLKETCQRLSGLISLIDRLWIIKMDSELHRFLGCEIKRRTSEVFGKPTVDPNERNRQNSSDEEESSDDDLGTEVADVNEDYCRKFPTDLRL